MTVPKSYEECEQRARAAAAEAIENWETRTVQYDTDLAEERYADVYGSELQALHNMMYDRFGNDGIARCANELIDLCQRLRFETGAPSTLEIVASAVIRSGDEHYQCKPQIALQEIIAALIAILGVDQVRAAVGE